MNENKTDTKTFSKELKEYFQINNGNIFIIEIILIFLVSLLIVLGIYHYDFFINNSYGNLISIFITISIIVFIKKKLVNKKSVKNNNDLIEKIESKYKIDYYNNQISYRMNIFNLLGVKIAIIAYILQNFIYKVEHTIGEVIIGIVIIFLVGVLFFTLLFNVTKYSRKINKELLNKK